MPNWGAGGAGAISGAAAGSALGPWGAAAGGVLGGALGLFGGSLDRSRGGFDSGSFNLPHYDSQYGQYQRIADQRRQAPQGAYSGFRGNQQQLIGQLESQVAGRGPGQELVARHAQDQADMVLRQQLAASQSARPGMGAQAAFGAAQAGGQAVSAAGGQRVMGGLQAQLNAIGQLGGALDSARGADEQMNMFNVDARLRQLGLDDQRQMEALRQALAASQSQQQGRIAYEQGRMGINMATPTGGERMLGALQGAGQMLMTRGAGGGGGGASTTLLGGYGGNGYGNGGGPVRYNPGPQYTPAF